ncbi:MULTISPECIES: hypothetical protein [unclassified Nocardiopsis]|uniref:hypothetical protein n=1 Tax=Nocardiopsis TaxID=2013 RepID=UPI00387AA6B0
MVTLQIKGVTEEERDALVRRARERGRSLQAFLLDLVREEVRMSRNAAALRAFEGRADGLGAQGEALSADLVRGERDERMRHR